MRAGPPIAATAALAVALLASCSNTQPSVNRRPNGGSATASEVGGVQQITVTAGDTYRFDPATITVHPGPVRVVFINRGTGAPHNWTLPGLAGTALTAAGASQTVTFLAPSPGSYRFVCTIHERQGQTGTLIVTPR